MKKTFLILTFTLAFIGLVSAQQPSGNAGSLGTHIVWQGTVPANSTITFPITGPGVNNTNEFALSGAGVSAANGIYTPWPISTGQTATNANGFVLVNSNSLAFATQFYVISTNGSLLYYTQDPLGLNWWNVVTIPYGLPAPSGSNPATTPLIIGTSDFDYLGLESYSLTATATNIAGNITIKMAKNIDGMVPEAVPSTGITLSLASTNNNAVVTNLDVHGTRQLFVESIANTNPVPSFVILVTLVKAAKVQAIPATAN